MQGESMISRNGDRRMQTSVGAVLLSSLIGIGFLITLGALGVAVGMSIGSIDAELPSSRICVPIAILSFVLLISAFFMAGFISSRLAHQRLRFDSVIHSLGTWAVMALLLVVLLSVAALVASLRRDLTDITLPSLVTDVQVFPLQAVTTVRAADDKKGNGSQKGAISSRMVAVVWGTASMSLLCGSGTSVAGGLLGRRRQPKPPDRIRFAGRV